MARRLLLGFCVTSADKTLPSFGALNAGDPNLGRVLAGRYRLLRDLGAGQMARLYVAEQIGLGRNVAIKLLHDDIELDEIAIGRFRQEIRVVAGLRSPHTITVFDAGETEEGVPFLAMELLVGETLRQRLDDRPLAPDEIIEIVAQIGASLTEAHDAGIVHRDLKPENVFLCAHPTPVRPFVKVLDFGLAKLVFPNRSTLQWTGQHEAVGTPAYMAPEQIVEGRCVDHRADVYALGVMCFEMLTGSRPYIENSVMKMALSHVAAPIPRASTRIAGLSSRVDQMFDRALAKAASERCSSATELAAALAAALR